MSFLIYSKQQKSPSKLSKTSLFVANTLVAFIAIGCRTPLHPTTGLAKSRVITTNRLVQLQLKRTFSSTNGIYASNEFPGARLNDFQQTGPTNFSALIMPENFPINDSAWFAFKLWSKSNQTITIELNYENGKHRYRPKISSDGASWKVVAPENFQRTASNSATLTLNIGPQPIFISGQELFTSQDFERWIGQLSKKSFVRSKTIGRSVRGKPIRKFEITEGSKDSDSLIIVSRQHPPEITGTFALQAFINAILQRYRARKKISNGLQNRRDSADESRRRGFRTLEA
jgi:cytosolic carboxypeptidase protein 6